MWLYILMSVLCILVLAKKWLRTTSTGGVWIPSSWRWSIRFVFWGILLHQRKLFRSWWSMWRWVPRRRLKRRLILHLLSDPLSFKFFYSLSKLILFSLFDSVAFKYVTYLSLFNPGSCPKVGGSYPNLSRKFF